MSTHLLILKRKKQKKKPPEAVERRDKPCKDVGRAAEDIDATTRIDQWAWRVKQSWIIRFSDNSMQGCYCTYGDAVLLGRKLADEKGLGFVVV